MRAIPKQFLAGGSVVFCVFLFGSAKAAEHADKVTEKFHTVVDFYTNIKGIEYVYCVIYIALFCVLYSYLFKNENNKTTGGKKE
ncbi:MAG: hypothetical protein BA862_06325 [Desulfobulbaceae bacterium S3730MH12]|nr:MAG: hypothetical protein BA862_06325 [Desulfobulbaceae bacterium S3730MH12]